MINQKYLHMETNKTHRDLDVWKVSMDLVIDLYRVTETFPKIEKYCLVTQIRRAGVSVCSNIAEGAGRGTDRDFCHFLDIARGSLFELDTLLILANDLEYVSEEELNPVFDSISEIVKMMVSFQSSACEAVRLKQMPWDGEYPGFCISV